MMQDQGVGLSATFSVCMGLTLTTIVRDPTIVSYLYGVIVHGLIEEQIVVKVLVCP